MSVEWDADSEEGPEGNVKGYWEKAEEEGGYWYSRIWLLEAIQKSLNGPSLRRKFLHAIKLENQRETKVYVRLDETPALKAFKKSVEKEISLSAGVPPALFSAEVKASIVSKADKEYNIRGSSNTMTLQPQGKEGAKELYKILLRDRSDVDLQAWFFDDHDQKVMITLCTTVSSGWKWITRNGDEWRE